MQPKSESRLTWSNSTISSLLLLVVISSDTRGMRIEVRKSFWIVPTEESYSVESLEKMENRYSINESLHRHEWISKIFLTENLFPGLFLLFMHLQYSMTACLQDKAPKVAWISFLFSLLPSAYARWGAKHLRSVPNFVFIYICDDVQFAQRM